MLRTFTILALVLTLAQAPCAAAKAPPTPEQPPTVTVGYRKVEGERVMIPTNDGSGRLLAANVFRPVTPGPRPMIILNHGYAPSPDERKDFAVPVFDAITGFLVANGYVVVLPRRRGYGPGDSVLNETSDCRNIDFARDGIETARDIEATLEFMSKQHYINKDHIVVMGHSGGGWGSLAIVSLNLKGVRAAINLSGGRRCHQDGSNDEKSFIADLSRQKLVEASAIYGTKSRVPTLWIYAANDRNRTPQQIAAMREAFEKAGGKAELLMLPPIGSDGHDTISRREIVTQWFPRVYTFLKEVEREAKRNNPLAETKSPNTTLAR
ncbi:MAG: prolyl oligopeptidase family serine peptidase [Hyphomicrobiaceae bacterium]|nr:MAG: prolyl oligopeptidase family serine peptidase [Hyphomicrobiaceae bacterium]